MGLLLLFARNHVLEPHKQGNIVFKVFGRYAAVGAEETTKVHMHSIDVLEMLIAMDFRLVTIKIIRSIGCEKHIFVAVRLEITGSNLVLIRQDHGALLLDMLAQGSIQFGSIHKAHAGHHGVKALVTVLYHAEYASLIFGGFGRVVGTTSIGLTRHIVVRAILIQASLAETPAPYVVALVADGNQHLVELDLTGHRGRLLVKKEGVKDLVSPCEGGLDTDITFLGTPLNGGARDSQFNEFFPNRGGLVGALKGSVGRGHKEVLATLAEVPLVASLEALLDHETLICFCLAVRAVWPLALEGVILDQAIATVSICAFGCLHHIHDLSHKLLLLVGREFF